MHFDSLACTWIHRHWRALGDGRSSAAGVLNPAIPLREALWKLLFEEPEKLERPKLAQKSLEGSCPCRRPYHCIVHFLSLFLPLFLSPFQSSFFLFFCVFATPFRPPFSLFFFSFTLFLLKPPSFHFLHPYGAFPTFSPSQALPGALKIEKKPPMNPVVF